MFVWLKLETETELYFFSRANENDYKYMENMMEEIVTKLIGLIAGQIHVKLRAA